MKKSILTIIIVTLLVSTLLLLTACNTALFPVSEERAGKQVTATATYADRVSIVGVGELYNSFYNYYNYLYTYYQYGYISAEQLQNYLGKLDETFETTNESLARSTLYTLKCIEYLENYYTEKLGADNQYVKALKDKDVNTQNKTYDFGKMAQLQQYFADRIQEIQAILLCNTDSEGNVDYTYYNAAVKSANDDLQSLLDGYIETIRSEYSAVQNSASFEAPESIKGISIESTPYRLVYEVGDSTLDTHGLKVVANLDDEKTLEIPVKELVIEGFDASETTDEQVITITYMEKTDSFTVKVEKARPSRKQPAKDEEEDEIDNTTKLAYFSFDVNKDDYVKDENGNLLTGDALAEAEQEYKIVHNAMTRLGNYLEKNYRTYNDYLYSYCVSQLKNLTKDVLASQISVSEEEIEQEYERLVDEKIEQYAHSKFDKDELDDLTKAYLQPKPEEGSYGYYYVSQVLFKYTDEVNAKIDDFKAKGANTSALDAFKIKVANEIKVWLSNPDYDADAKCEDENCTCPRCANYQGDPVYYTDLDQWYDHKDCSCVACPAKKYLGLGEDNNPLVGAVIDAIVASLDETNAQYQDHNSLEYREALLETINEWIYKANEDDGAFSAITDKKYGYVMTPTTEESGMVASFEAVCDALAEHDGKAFTEEELAELAKEGVFILSQQGGVGSYGWCVSTYGIHFVVLTAYAIDPAYGEATDVTIGEDVYQKMDVNYVTSLYDYDDSAETEPAKGTIKYDVYKTLIDEKVDANYAKFQKDFIVENEENCITYYPEGYQYMLDKIQNNK